MSHLLLQLDLVRLEPFYRVFRRGKREIEFEFLDFFFFRGDFRLPSFRQRLQFDFVARLQILVFVLQMLVLLLHLNAIN